MIAELGKKGKTKSKGQILEEAGYNKDIQLHPKKVFGNVVVRDLLLKEMEKAGITESKVSKRLNWLIDGAGEDNHIATMNGIKEYMKVVGGYAPVKTENKIEGTILHEISDDGGRYMKFLEQENQELKVIEGVEVK